MVDKIPIAVLGSGRGSNFDAIMNAIRTGKLDAKVAVVASDRPYAPILEKARLAGVPAVVVPVPKAATREEANALHGEALLREILPFGPRFVVLAGYMRVLSPGFLQAFRSERGYARVVNIHPSLLPAFPGVDSYGQAFRHGVKVAGVSVHLVDTGLDQGPLCAQEAFSIGECRSASEVEERGLLIEHRMYENTLRWVLPERFDVEQVEGRIIVRQD